MTGESPLSRIDEFARLYFEREDFERRIQNTPELLADLLQQGLIVVDARLAELAEDPTVRDYYIKLGGEVTRAAQELDELEPTLRQLGLEEQVEAKRREIEGMTSGPNMRAASYFLQLSKVEITALKPVRPSPGAGERREKEKQRLTILVDPNNNISINSKVMSLSRDLQAAGKVGAEAAGRQLRVDIIRFLAVNPESEFRASEIWQVIRPNSEFGRGLWNLYCKEFFRKEFTYGRKPIVRVDTVAPRLLKYSLKDFNLTVDETDKPLKITNETLFTLPDGKEVGGKTGKLLYMLARATEQKPVTDVNTLYTLEELRALKKPKTVLSALVSVARREIQGTNLSIIKVLTEERDPESHYKYPGYYMTEIEPEEEPLSLDEATILAGFLNHHRDKLIRNGLEPLPEEVFEALNEQVVTTYSNGEKSQEELEELRVQAFEKAIALLSDDDLLEENVQKFVEKEDPRMDLLIHLLSYSREDQVAYIKQLLGARTDLEVTFDAGRRKGFQIVEVRSLTVGEHGNQL